jgi:phosphatidylglycerol---prolipoprotein diacylglyceryl transferase
MYALALSLSAGITAATTGLPFFHLGAVAEGVPIQWFGMIVAAGVVIGSIPMRRYAEWHGVSDDHIRGLLTWLLISGFLGAHLFDVVAYQWERIGDSPQVTPASWWFLPDSVWPSNWPLIIRFWDGISSYGGFIGGAIGFSLYVWWKRLPARLLADATIVGLLPAFSIGRIGCTVVSDHIGAAVDPARWYAVLAMEYPRAGNLGQLADTYPGTSKMILAWNLGLVEMLYLVPVNALILWLAFRTSRRSPAGFVTVLTGVLYAPVRFFLDYLRPEHSDPRIVGLTFAQWSSVLAFGVAVYAATRIMRSGQPAETVAASSREAQAKLRQALQDADEGYRKQEAAKKAEAERKQAEIARLRAERDREDAASERAQAAAAGKPSLEAAAGPAAAVAEAAKPATVEPEASAAQAAGNPAQAAGNPAQAAGNPGAATKPKPRKR